jgi:hypothetical protein
MAVVVTPGTLTPSPLRGEGWGEGTTLCDVSSLRGKSKKHIDERVVCEASATIHPNPLPNREREPKREVA